MAFFIGSIPTGLIIAKANGVDLKKKGSGNIGATNVLRSVGKWQAFITLTGDFLKGVIAVLIGRHFFEGHLYYEGIVGLFSILGHNYSIFLKFRGGKGVATALGVFLGIAPLAVCGALLVFGSVVWRSRYISLGSITAAAAMPAFVALFNPQPALLLMTVAVAALVIWKHRENIQRLRAGTENRFKA